MSVTLRSLTGLRKAGGVDLGNLRVGFSYLLPFGAERSLKFAHHLHPAIERDPRVPGAIPWFSGGGISSIESSGGEGIVTHVPAGHVGDDAGKGLGKL